MLKKIYKIIEKAHWILSIAVIIAFLVNFFIIPIPRIILLPIQLGFIITGTINIVYKHNEIAKMKEERDKFLGKTKKDKNEEKEE
jgi:hypothetical protein